MASEEVIHEQRASKAVNRRAPEPGQRQAAILRIVQTQGFATLEELASRFGLSVQTVRRDVIQLDRAGLLQRFHGGAGVRNSVRLGYAEKKTVSSDAKARIGREVARLIPDGSVVFIDVGTTCEQVAWALVGRNGLRVFTSSLAVGSVFAGHGQVETVVIGGTVAGADGSLVGPPAVEQIAQIRFDFAVIGLSGFDEDGWAMDFDLDKVAVKRAALVRAHQRIAAVDGGKFLRHAVVRVASLDTFTALVTDAPPPEAFSAMADKATVRLVVATT